MSGASIYKVSVLKGVRYETPTGTRMMDIYLPNLPEPAEPVPCLVWMGLSRPSARDDSVCGDLAGAGFVTARIDFEPDDTPSDRPVVIGKCAVRFLRASAAKFHIDGRRIAIAGSSMAGGFALLVGFTRNEPRFAVKGAYPGVSDRVSAVVTLSAMTDWRKPPANLKGWSAEAMEELRVLSPVTYVTADSPPILIFHGTNDKSLPQDHAINLRKLLATHGVPHRLVLLPQVGHTYNLVTANGRPLPEDVKGICASFLRKYFAEPK